MNIKYSMMIQVILLTAGILFSSPGDAVPGEIAEKAKTIEATGVSPNQIVESLNRIQGVVDTAEFIQNFVPSGLIDENGEAVIDFGDGSEMKVRFQDDSVALGYTSLDENGKTFEVRLSYELLKEGPVSDTRERSETRKDASVFVQIRDMVDDRDMTKISTALKRKIFSSRTPAKDISAKDDPLILMHEYLEGFNRQAMAVWAGSSGSDPAALKTGLQQEAEKLRSDLYQLLAIEGKNSLVHSDRHSVEILIFLPQDN